MPTAISTSPCAATRLAISVNGQLCLVNTSGDKAFNKKYIMAFTAGLGMGANAPTADSQVPATMSVDYVRVWQ